MEWTWRNSSSFNLVRKGGLGAVAVGRALPRLGVDWRACQLGFVVGTQLTCEVAWDKRTPFVLQTFRDLMFLNEALDDEVPRARLGQWGDDMKQWECFWGVTQRFQRGKEKGLRLGFYEGRFEALEQWLEGNRLLNFASFYRWHDKEIPWGSYSREKLSSLGDKVKRTFEDWQERGLLAEAILFRSLSSVGFAKGLADLLLPTEKVGDSANLRRMAAMTMACQVWDDLGSPVRDVANGALGIAAVCLAPEKRLRRVRPLLMDEMETKKAVEVGGGILKACLDEMDLGVGWKPLLVKQGLIGLGCLAVARMAGDFGGSRYDWKAAAGEVFRGAVSSAEKGEVYNWTREALTTGMNVFGDW